MTEPSHGPLGRPLRILWASDAVDATSGYANQTRLAVPRLAALGYDIALLATFGHHGAVREWNGIRIYPGGADPFANDVIAKAAADWRADIVITLKDTLVFRPEAFHGLRWLPLTPIDHEPAPPTVIHACRASFRPIAYAPNGFRALRAAGLDPAYAPHGYDPTVYNPQPRDEARRFLGLPDELFIVTTVAVNRGGIPSRKAWPQNLEGFAAFAKDKPNVLYFIHTDLADDGYEAGVPIRRPCAELGIDDKVIFCDQQRYRYGGFPENYLHALYCASDVVNTVSVGEGFGIPTLEAQACGVPVITSDFAASRDLCFAGWKVKDGFRFYDSQGSYVFLPEPAAIAQAMEYAYRALQRDRVRDWLRKKALAGAAPYQIDRVIQEYWVPLLTALEHQIATEASRGVLRIVRREEVLA